MYGKILVANRGEIARRVMRTARRLGVATVAVYSDADANGAHVADADEAVRIGPAPAAESYLNGAAIIDAARRTGAQAIHPGYGFLSENADFAAAVIAAGIDWIGPDPETIRILGDKARARSHMARAGVPVNGGGRVDTPAEAVALARRIGFPVIVKAAAGGGGIGMRIVADADGLAGACAQTQAQATRFFGDGTILIERFMGQARHVEIQILGLSDGRVLTLGERDCSVQRRYQKVIEESPCPVLGEALRARMCAAAAAGAASLDYVGAGTFEFLVAGDDFIFLEVNARLQVEHAVTELVTGIDLVEAQLCIACGDPLPFDPDAIRPQGHAIELRVYAEDPVKFLPGGGTITQWVEPAGEGIRIDAGYRLGDEVTAFYDPLMAKLCAYGATRDEAIDRAARAVRGFAIAGPKKNLDFLDRMLASEAFRSGDYDIGIVAALQSGERH